MKKKPIDYEIVRQRTLMFHGSEVVHQWRFEKANSTPSIKPSTVIFDGVFSKPIDVAADGVPTIDPTPEDHNEVLQAWNLAQARAEARPKTFGNQ